MRKQEQKGKITALYERLSHDDGRSAESVSVENQKRILEDYARKNGFTNVRHFTDDGVRGTTFKRPGLDAMVDEIRAGNVATVIVKDQSRIGRDVVEVGLLKRTFDEYNVRFIAANDNLDTANGFDIMSIFRDVINEWYVADTSRKIKTVFKSRMEKGLRCSGAVPYGYLASKEEKGEWVIDEEAAAVVRRIFQMVMDGQSKSPSLPNTGSVSAVLFEPTATATPTHGLPPPWVIFLKGRSTWGARCWARLSVRTTRLKAPAGQCQRNNLYLREPSPPSLTKKRGTMFSVCGKPSAGHPSGVMPLTV